MALLKAARRSNGCIRQLGNVNVRSNPAGYTLPCDRCVAKGVSMTENVERLRATMEMVIEETCRDRMAEITPGAGLSPSG
jgi:hypothetical protein